MSGPGGATLTVARPAGSAGRRRRVGATAALLLITAAAAVAAICLGGYPLPVTGVVETLLGGGSAAERFVVLDIRLPRVTMAVLVGAALGLAGALMQALLDNPLASPDIIGITQGASVGAVTGLLVLGWGGLAVSGAALAGALAAAVAIHLLAWRDGVTGQRFVLIGIAIAFMGQAALGYMLTRADVRDAQSAWVWLVGSVGSARWDEIGLLAAAVAVLAPLALALGPSLRVLQFGDDAATGLGVRAQRARAAVIAVAVALAAAGVAAAGPVAFVAFMAAPIARRIAGGGLALLPAALVGAAVVALADLAGRHLLPGDVQVPVGVVTGAVGAPYLLWLLATGARGGRTA